MFCAFVRILNPFWKPCGRIPTDVALGTRMQLHCCGTVCATKCEAYWVSLFLVRGVHERSRSLTHFALRNPTWYESELHHRSRSSNFRADIAADRLHSFCMLSPHSKRRRSRTRCFEAGTQLTVVVRHWVSDMLGVRSYISIFVLCHVNHFMDTRCHSKRHHPRLNTARPWWCFVGVLCASLSLSLPLALCVCVVFWLLCTERWDEREIEQNCEKRKNK